MMEIIIIFAMKKIRKILNLIIKDIAFLKVIIIKYI